MSEADDNLALLFIIFAPLSLMAVGGGSSIIAMIQNEVVDVQRWVTGGEFLVMFAISTGSPGPDTMMLATLIGWKVAGLAGAAVTMLAMFVPSSVLCVGVAALMRRYRGRRAISLFEQSTLPIGAGLIVAGIVSLGQLSAANPTLLIIAGVSSLVCLLRPGVHPMVIIALGASANFAVTSLWGA